MSDQMPGQGALFDEEPPGAAVTAVEASDGPRVPRTPGWSLLAPPGGLWHRVDRRRYDGMLTASCGVTGRYVADDEREIIKCSSCEATEPI